MKNPFRKEQNVKEQAQHLQAELDRQHQIGKLQINPAILPGQVVQVNKIPPAYAYQQPEKINPVTVDDPAMQATLDELSNLWAAKFGDVWVKVEEIQDSDAFWSVAVKRLLSRGYLEFFPELQVYRLCK